MLAGGLKSTPTRSAEAALPFKYRRKSAWTTPVVKIEPIEDNLSILSLQSAKPPALKTEPPLLAPWTDGPKLVQLNTPEDPIDIDAELGEADMDLCSTRSNSPEPSEVTCYTTQLQHQDTENINFDSLKSPDDSESTLCDSPIDHLYKSPSTDALSKVDDTIVARFIQDAIVDLTKDSTGMKHNFGDLSKSHNMIDLTHRSYTGAETTSTLPNCETIIDLTKESTMHPLSAPKLVDLTDLDDLYGTEPRGELSTSVTSGHSHLSPLPITPTQILPSRSENAAYLSLLDDDVPTVKAEPLEDNVFLTDDREDSLDRILNGQDDRYAPTAIPRPKSSIAVDLTGLFSASPSVRPSSLARSRSRSVSVPLSSLMPYYFSSSNFRSANLGHNFSAFKQKVHDSMPTPPPSVIKPRPRGRRQTKTSYPSPPLSSAAGSPPTPELSIRPEIITIECDVNRRAFDFDLPTPVGKPRAARRGVGRRKVKSALYVTDESDTEGVGVKMGLQLKSTPVTAASFVKKEEDPDSDLALLRAPAPTKKPMRRKLKVSAIKCEGDRVTFETPAKKVSVKREPALPTRRSQRIPKPRIKAEIEEFTLVPHNPPRKPRTRRAPPDPLVSPLAKKRKVGADGAIFGSRVKPEPTDGDGSFLLGSGDTTQEKIFIRIGADKMRHKMPSRSTQLAT